jgi:hypothetical protein
MPLNLTPAGDPVWLTSSGFGERSSGVSLQLVDQLAPRRLGLRGHGPR